MRQRQPKPKPLVIWCIYAAVLLWLGFWLVAGAAEVTITWTNATQNVDGTPAELASTTVRSSLCVAGDYDAATSVELVTVDFPAETASAEITEPGDYCFRAHHTSTAGVDSDLSNLATRTILPAQPQPPGTLTVQDLQAYGVYKTRGRFVLAVVGTVPAGTQCDPTQTVNGHYAVPVEAVTFTDPAKAQSALLTVARCGG